MAGYIGSKAVSVNTTSATISDDLAVGDDLTVTDDATVGGTLGVTGIVTASDDVKLAHDGAVLGFGAGNDVTLTHVHDTGLLLNSTMALQFNDASQFINAPSATVLDITATDEVELNATAIDLNGTLDVSGAAHFGADVDLLQGNHIRFKHAAGGTIRASISAESADDLQFNTGSSETARMTIDTNGNVGLGTDSPTVQDTGMRLLHIHNPLTDGNGRSSLKLTNGDSGLSASRGAIVTLDDQATLTIGSFESAGSIAFTSGGTATRMLLDASGNLNINSGNLVVGTAGKGIDFSAQTQSSSSTTSELLDHYEEGTWTPVFQGSSGTGSYSYTASTVARYTRVGNLVTLSASLMNITEGTAMGGYVQITGLPFTKPASTYGSGAVGISQWNLGFEVVTPQLEPVSYGGTTTTLYIHLHKNNAASTNLLTSQLTDTNSDIVFVFTYQV